MITRSYLLHALSPLHAGTGQSIGLIDLPIARERTTDHPLVPGSSLKGVLRDAARRLNEPNIDAIFGSITGTSMVRISDARILAFPVKSDRGTFAWVTSPYVLLRFVRESGASLGFTATEIPDASDNQATCLKNAAVVDADKLTLDGLPYTYAAADENSEKLFAALANALFPEKNETGKAWRTFFAQRLVVVSDNAFTWFTQNATDVRAHVRIGMNGTVEKGALWHVETLPPETVLAGILQVAAIRGDQDPNKVFELLGQLASDPIQVGGDATTGAGRVRLVLGGEVK